MRKLLFVTTCFWFGDNQQILQRRTRSYTSTLYWRCFVLYKPKDLSHTAVENDAECLATTSTSVENVELHEWDGLLQR